MKFIQFLYTLLAAQGLLKTALELQISYFEVQQTICGNHH